MVAFSIASLNVDGIRDDDKRARIFEYLRSLKHDFFLIQKTHVQAEDVQAWYAEWGGPCFWNPGGNKSRGVGILYNVSLGFADLEVKRDFYGHFVNVKLSLHDWKFQIMCVYAPNDPRGRSDFSSDLWRHMFYGIPLFLGGDFNCIENLELDKAGGDVLAGDKGSAESKDFVDSVSLCDVFRVKFPQRKLFTRHNKANTNISRIDRIYAPKGMIPDAFGYTFNPCSYSDHDLVSVKFNCKQMLMRGEKLFTRHNKVNTNISRIDWIYAPKSMIPDAFGYTFNPCSYSDHDLASVKFNCKQMLMRGPGLWKFNSSLTQDDDYTGLMTEFLQDWKLQKERYPDLRTWWDVNKSHIRTITVDFATAKRREKRSLRSDLVRQLCSAEQEHVPSAGVITDLR